MKKNYCYFSLLILASFFIKEGLPQNEITTVAVTQISATTVVFSLSPSANNGGENGTDISSSSSPTVIGNATDQQNDTFATMIALFDCRRSGHDCFENGGACELDTGLCSCNENYTGFDCSYLMSSVVSNTFCNNGEGCGSEEENVCVNKAGGRRGCFCSYSKFGQSCEKPRYELKCSDSQMTINATPFQASGPFFGQIFVVDSVTNVKNDKPECQFNKTGDTFTLPVSFTDLQEKCGGEHPDNETHHLKFVVQSDPDWLTTYDQLVTASCTFKTAHEYLKTIVVDTGGAAILGQQVQQIYVSNELTNIAANEIRAERKQVTTTTVLPRPVLTLGRPNFTKDGQETIEPISGSVKLGDLIVFTIENINDTFYSGIRGEDCTLKMDDTMEARLIKDVCPFSRFAWTLFQWSRTKATNMSISYYLRLPANALAGQPRQITIACRVKLCAHDVVEQCALPDDGCKSVTSRFVAPSGGAKMTSSGGRKRRSADDQQKAELETASSPAYAYVVKTVDVSYDELDLAQQMWRKSRNRYTTSSKTSSLPRGNLFFISLALLVVAIISNKIF